MSETMWALIDANNFFVSCERVFRPDLITRPVLVLSANDGCVVSRSQEVKDLGIAMGVPRFQIEEAIKQAGVVCFSSNFRLYGDLSSRLMTIIRKQVGGEDQEIYSIDECFVRLGVMSAAAYQAWGEGLKRRINQEIGIPVTVGIAPTKTLAKLAADIAKKDVLGSGVLVWPRHAEAWRGQYLSLAPITNVWGIGRASARQLLARRVQTVGDFLQWSPVAVRDWLGLAGERTWQELQGVSCVELTEVAPARRQILRSRSFGETVTTQAELRRAVGEFVAIAGQNLRQRHYRASLVTVFIRTSYHVERARFYSAAWTVGLVESTSFWPDLAAAAAQALRQIYRPGVAYKKAGVILAGLEAEAAWQPALGLDRDDRVAEPKKQRLMAAVDRLNRHYGTRRVTIGLASDSFADAGQRVVAKWRSRQTARSPEYSTNWRQLRVVH